MDIAVRFGKGKVVEALFDGRTVRTDQPRAEGGAESAPSPFELFLASIATCAGYYVLDFCLSRHIPTEGITLSMQAERDPETHMISKVAIEIHLPPTFPEKYEKAVVRAAELCTVKRHMQQAPAFEIVTAR